MNIHMFNAIKDSAHIANAAAAGLPLGLFRPGDASNRVYEKIASYILQGSD